MCCQAGDRPPGEGEGRVRSCPSARPFPGCGLGEGEQARLQPRLLLCFMLVLCGGHGFPPAPCNELTVHPSHPRALCLPCSSPPSGLPARRSVRNSACWGRHSCENSPASATQFRGSPWTGSQQNVALGRLFTRPLQLPEVLLELQLSGDCFLLPESFLCFHVFIFLSIKRAIW